jgi:probable O-glycosylation ligase (exosortase A-associated)
MVAPPVRPPTLGNRRQGQIPRPIQMTDRRPVPPPHLPREHRAHDPVEFFRAHRRILSVAAALMIGVIAGIAIVNIPPLLVFGAVGCSIAVYLIIKKPFFGLILYTITFMLRPGEIYPALRSLHIERLIGALALLAMYLEQHWTSRRIFVDGTRQTRLLLLLTVPVLISIPFAYWRSAALSGFVDFLKLVAWYLLAVHLLNTRTRLRIYTVLFLALICYVAYDSFSAYLSGSYHFRMGIARAAGQTEAGGDPNHLAATMAATIPLLLLLAFYKPLHWLRMLPAAGVLLLTVTLAVTGSRSGLLGFFGGLLFLWSRARHRLVVGVIGIFVLGLGILALPDQYKVRYASITRSELDSSSQGRLNVWMRGVRMLYDRPLTGVGIGCFSTANAMRYSPPGEPSYLESHSLYVQTPAELGLIGAAVFFLFLYEMLRLNRRTSRELRATGRSWQFEATVLTGLTAGVVVLLITSIFGHSFLRHTWYVYAALGAAITRLYADRPSSPGFDARLPLIRNRER